MLDWPWKGSTLHSEKQLRIKQCIDNFSQSLKNSMVGLTQPSKSLISESNIWKCTKFKTI